MTSPPTLGDLMADSGELDVTCLDCHHNTTRGRMKVRVKSSHKGDGVDRTRFTISPTLPRDAVRAIFS